MVRWAGWKRRFARLGIILLILSVARVPVPIPDLIGPFHAEAAGLACPEEGDFGGNRPAKPSGLGIGVSWRWVVLNTDSLCGSRSAIGSESADCHPDWSSCEHNPSPHYLYTRTTTRFTNPFAIAPIDDLRASLAWRSWAPARPASARLAKSFGATFPPRTSLSALLSRWIC